MDVVDLCTSSEDENDAPQQRRSVVMGKRKAESAADAASVDDDSDGDDSDDDCGFVDPPARGPVVGASSSATSAAAGAAGALSDDEDEDLQVVGRSGALALADFPHSRHNCLSVKFTAGNEHMTCPNCFWCVAMICTTPLLPLALMPIMTQSSVDRPLYCTSVAARANHLSYVCDKQASSCAQWADHCKAIPDDPPRGSGFWKRQRDAAIRAASAPAAAASAPAAAAAPATASAAAAGSITSFFAAPSRLQATGPHAVWTCEQLLASMQQVYPHELPEPAGLLSTARLKPYQRQSLAFMVNVERSTDPSLLSPGARRGGWLTDEVGMGKTMVAIATILANPPAAAAAATTDRLTVIVTPNSIAGQWHDEFKQWAPGLKVVMYYGTHRAQAKASAHVANVVITTPHSVEAMDPRFKGRVHRLIVDEIHTYNTSPNSTAMRSICKAWEPSNVWLLTGTPFTSSLRELAPGFELLRGAPPVLGAVGNIYEMGPSATVASALKQLMIRHTKTMRIGGEVALSLPAADCSTVRLTMSVDERALYARAEKMDGRRLEHLRAVGGATFAIEQSMLLRRQACANTYPTPAANKKHTEKKRFTEQEGQRMRSVAVCSKLRALRDDLRQLVAQDAHAHAVVFTHHAATHERLKSVGREEGLEVYEISGSMQGEARHQAIRIFQSSGERRVGKPALFVITVKTGAVGITLTAASRVYLFEPALDPAAEVQMAGRIHRLGQTQDVLIKRFIFSETIEERIDQVHAQMRDGRVAIANGGLPGNAIAILARRFA